MSRCAAPADLPQIDADRPQPLDRLGGGFVRQVKMPDVYPTNICFGGADMKTAHVTHSGTGQFAALDWLEPDLRCNVMAWANCIRYD